MLYVQDFKFNLTFIRVIKYKKLKIQIKNNDLMLLQKLFFNQKISHVTKNVPVTFSRGILRN